MNIVTTVDELRQQLKDWRQSGDHTALVPTMGNLHQGHMGLIELAREHAERIIVSIFVNPTQFDDDSDFERYPRTLDRDKARLKRAGVDMLFIPEVDTMYPFGTDNATSVSVPILGEEFCGSSRPGHFNGVTSVVNRLFSLVQPDVAIFGQKDYQQQIIIRRMTEDLSLPIRIVTGETVRDDDGLALSSRNQYLTEDERTIAPKLYAALQVIGNELQAGKRDYEGLESAATKELNGAGFEVDYVEIRRAENLNPPNRDCDELVVLAAAQLGVARLIDNIVVSV